jgi:hypothetical protein
MIKRPTWILLIILALVFGAFFLVRNKQAGSSQDTPTPLGNSYLITSADGTIESIRVSDGRGQVVQFQKDPNGVWVVTLPQPGDADQGVASAAETQVEALLIVATLDTPPGLDTVGLAAPTATIDLTFSDGTQHKLEIGGLTSIGSGYYVRMDQSKVYVVSNSGIDALLNLLAAPPYVPTPTPAPTAESTVTETVTPTP